MEDYFVTVEKKINVTQQDIDDIMATALEGGITYWCNKATVVGDYLGEYASEQISRGGTLILHDAEEDYEYVLNIDNFLEGLQQAIEDHWFEDYEWYIGNELDTCNVDAEVADVIIQLALFGDIIYG